MGFGAHPDHAVALRRAVGEAAQMVGALPTDPAGSRAGAWAADPITRRWCAAATLANQPYLRPDPALPAVPVRPGGGTGDVLADLAGLRGRVEAAGAEVLVLDQTRPEIGFPTVRVVAPGLRHFWVRLAPGRLYEVPVRQGWLARPADEADLNPYPMPI
jgi:oxazoline/thiazoline synthase